MIRWLHSCRGILLRGTTCAPGTHPRRRLSKAQSCASEPTFRRDRVMVSVLSPPHTFLVSGKRSPTRPPGVGEGLHSARRVVRGVALFHFASPPRPYTDVAVGSPSLAVSPVAIPGYPGHGPCPQQSGEVRDRVRLACGNEVDEVCRFPEHWFPRSSWPQHVPGGAIDHGSQRGRWSAPLLVGWDSNSCSC